MKLLPSLALAGALVVAPALAFASTQTTAAPKAAAKASQKAAKPAAKTAATHSTSGVVKSVDASTLVITRGKKGAATETFTVSASTERKGDVAAGARVEVRYRNEGGQHVATAIRVR